MTIGTRPREGDENLCRQLQAETGWSTDTLAEKLQISENAAEQWLNDAHTPTPEQRDRAARLRHRYHAQHTPIPDLLDELKKEMRWDNKDIASKLNVTHAAVSNWMQGRSGPSHNNKPRVKRLYVSYLTQTTLLDVIRALRDDTDLTDDDIAARVGVAKSTVSHWFREENNPHAHEHRTSLGQLYTEHFSTNGEPPAVD